MYYHVSIHHPKPGMRDVLMRLAIGESQKTFQASVHLARSVVRDRARDA